MPIRLSGHTYKAQPIEFVRGGGGYRSALFVRWRAPWMLIVFLGGWPDLVWLCGGLCD